jgi:hypothetical protein
MFYFSLWECNCRAMRHSTSLGKSLLYFALDCCDLPDVFFYTEISENLVENDVVHQRTRHYVE